jgi:hypothetical protein
MKEMIAALLLRASERHEASFDHFKAEALHRKIDEDPSACADFSTCYTLTLYEACHATHAELGPILYLMLRQAHNDALEWATDTLQGYPKSSAGGLARKALPLGGYLPNLQVSVMVRYHNGYAAEFPVEVQYLVILAGWLERDSLVARYSVVWPVTSKGVTPADLNYSEKYAKWLV